MQQPRPPLDSGSPGASATPGASSSSNPKAGNRATGQRSAETRRRQWIAGIVAIVLTGATAGVAVAVNFGAANARVPSGAGVLSPAVLETVDTVVTTTPAPTTNVRTAPVSTHVPDDDGHDDDGNESDEDDSDRDHNGGRSEKGEEHEEYEGRDDDD